MKKKTSFFIFIFFLLIASSHSVFSAFRTESNKVPTIVGNPPVDTALVSGAFSCPLKGARTIGCASFKSDPKFNRLRCQGAEASDRGHCNRANYKECWKGSDDLTDNQRRAHAIDVDGSIGEPVYLPTIEGKIVEWTYVGPYVKPISDGDGGGHGHVFQTRRLENNLWYLHLVHVSASIIPPPTGKPYRSGDQVTTIAATRYPHVHINIGKNPASLDFGPGWFSPEDLGMCVS